ncbi:MAG TPA: putative lipid II flippase FtsW [Vicinamibacterales bacterium]|nr:putative lipid II flippase FtsW [Vicinamibacterales bacterium]
MARKLKSDKMLFLATLLLVGCSVVMVYSASAVLAMNRFNQPYFFLIKQGMWAAFGLAVMSIAMRFDYRNYREPSFIWFALAVVGCALVAVLFLAPINGSRRWFGIGGFGVQPSELAKLSAIFFIAALLERRMDRIDDIPYALVPVGIVVGGLVGLILLEPDLGTAMTVLLIATTMVFAAGISYRYVVGAILCGLPIVYFILMGAAYRRRRLMAFWDPWSDPLGDGFQVIQSMIAVGSGGLLGRGFMSGVQKLFYLPEPHTDFIYAVIAEEFGLIGTTLIMACFVIIAWRGFKIATQAPDRFGAFLAIGLTTMIVAQALFNISVVLGLVPTKGIPLPFVSAGGSSLLISLLGMGILLNVSQHTAPGT